MRAEYGREDADSYRQRAAATAAESPALGFRKPHRASVRGLFASLSDAKPLRSELSNGKAERRLGEGEGHSAASLGGSANRRDVSVMDNSSPEQRIVGQIRGQPDACPHLDIILGIPIIYLIGLAIWWVLGSQLLVVVGCSSLLAWAILLKDLFVTPPTD